MRKWFLKQVKKLGFEGTSLKTEAEINGRLLDIGESESIVFPHELIEDEEWRIVEWFFEKGQLVNPGDVIGAVEDSQRRFEFETFVGGELNYFKRVGQKVEGGTVLAEIIGTRKS